MVVLCYIFTDGETKPVGKAPIGVVVLVIIVTPFIVKLYSLVKLFISNDILYY